jgi:cell wall-associated NlpC family hydrolase
VGKVGFPLKSDPGGADLPEVRLSLVAGALAVALAAPAAGAGTAPSWAASAIATVTKAGVLAGTPATFRPADPFTAGDLTSLLSALGKTSTPPANPSASVSIARLDAALVGALGLRSAARAFGAGAKAAGLEPPARFGTEVVARLLGLRTDLPVADDALELQPQQPATRADAAFTAARILSLGREVEGGVPAPGLTPLAAAAAGWGVQYVSRLAASFTLPVPTQAQQAVLRTAVSLIGYPYVWGGESEKTEIGFDCSGFVWRVFDGTAYAGAPALATVFRGRTAAQMAGEVPRSDRIGRNDLQPGDVLFFGVGPHSKAAQIGHASIYLGNGWLIEASGQGVSLAPLAPKAKTFAWARRPLAEAAPVVTAD